MMLRGRTKEEFLANQAAVFDAGPLKDDPVARAVLLDHAARLFDEEVDNAQGAQPGGDSRIAGDDGAAKCLPSKSCFSFFWLYAGLAFGASLGGFLIVLLLLLR